MEVSIWDVAKRAGVSKSTVSRALNGDPVSQASYEKVIAAVKELGYRPNYMARGLRGSSSPVIGVLSFGGKMFRTPSLCTRFAGVSDVLQRHGYDIFLVHDDYDNFNGIYTPKYITYLAEKRINGLITLGASDHLESQIKNAATQFRNVVYTGDRILPDKGFRVYLGNYNYSYDLFHLLLEYGHRRIMMVYCDENNVLFQRRDAALKAAARDLGIEDGEIMISHVFYEEEEYLPKTSKLQEIVYRSYIQGGFTAIFADESMDASRILSVFAQNGKFPGKDYSLVSIDENERLPYKESITAVHLPNYDYGKRIAELMIEVIENEALEYRDVYMSYSLTKGTSVINLKKK